MMKKTNRLLYFTFSVLFLLGACSSDHNQPAKLQFVSMLPLTNAKLEIRATKDSSVVHANMLSYAQMPGYNTFKPGAYTIRYSVDNEPLLEKTFVLGKNSYQTMLIIGLKPDSTYLNPQNFWYSIKHIFAGSEASSSNGYLPQFIMLRDSYDVNPNNAKIRLINAAPLSPGITLKNNSNSLFNDIAYPRYSDPQTIKPGPHSFHFIAGNVLINKKDFELKEGNLSTIIIGNSDTSAAKLKITSYQMEDDQ